MTLVFTFSVTAEGHTHCAADFSLFFVELPPSTISFRGWWQLNKEHCQTLASATWRDAVSRRLGADSYSALTPTLALSSRKRIKGMNKDQEKAALHCNSKRNHGVEGTF